MVNIQYTTVYNVRNLSTGIQSISDMRIVGRRWFFGPLMRKLNSKNFEFKQNFKIDSKTLTSEVFLEYSH